MSMSPLFSFQHTVDSQLSELIPCVFIATKSDLPRVKQVPHTPSSLPCHLSRYYAITQSLFHEISIIKFS